MIYLQAKTKGSKIKVNPKRDINVPMYCVVEIDKGRTVSKVRIKSLTGEIMIHDGGDGNMIVKNIYVNKALGNNNAFKVLDEFNFFNIK